MWLHIPNLPASTSAADTVDLNSDSNLPASMQEPWLTLSGTPTQRPLSWRGWQRRTWIRLLSGTISQPLMAKLGAEKWIASLQGSLASRSVRQANSWELRTTAGFGLPSNESFVMWDPVLCSWKTSPNLFGEVLHLSSVTLPSSGSMRNGVCIQRPRLAHHTNVTASGYWPTAQATSLDNWATPRAVNPSKNTDPSYGETLHQMACGSNSNRQWPTPTAHDPKDMGSPPAAKQRHSPGLPVIAEAHGHQLEMETGTSTSARVDLNPHFVEQLMGLPKGWLTPCTSVETASYQQWLQQHSLNYSTDTNTDA